MFRRLEILTNLNFDLPKLANMLPESARFKTDDLFDAAILSWTASRLFKRQNKKFPSQSPTNTEVKYHSCINV